MGRRIVFADHLEKLEERSIAIDMGEGRVFKIPPPELWPDSVDSVDERGTVVILIGGEERYAEFEAAGGNYRMVVALMNEGFEASIPESSASNGSSRNTRGRSNTTSSTKSE